MLFLLFKKTCRDEQREVDILDPGLLELCIQNPLDVFPDRKAVGKEDNAPGNAAQVSQACVVDDILVPLGKILTTLFEFLCFQVLHRSKLFRLLPNRQIHLPMPICEQRPRGEIGMRRKLNILSPHPVNA